MMLYFFMSTVFISCTPSDEVSSLYVETNSQVLKPSHTDDKIIKKIPPTSKNLDVEFHSQAPFGDWSLPYQEACEEASIITAMNFIRGISMTQDEFKNEILKLVEYQKQTFGDYLHTDVEQTKYIIEDYYEYNNVLIIENPKILDIKEAISSEGVVLVPLAGQHINNPFYSGEGPVYHFLVIRGYSETEFITNDVGTRRGDGLRYPYETIMNNIHDYAEPIKSGVPRIIVVKQ